MLEVYLAKNIFCVFLVLLRCVDDLYWKPWIYAMKFFVIDVWYTLAGSVSVLEMYFLIPLE